MSNKEAVEAAYQAAYHAEWRCICPPEEGCDMTVCRCAIRVAIAAARPHILEEAARIAETMALEFRSAIAAIRAAAIRAAKDV